MTKKSDFDFSHLFQGIDMNAFDPMALMEIQRKNVEAMVAANQKIAENMQAIAQQEQQYFQGMMSGWSGAVGDIKSPDDMKKASAKQMQFAMQSLEAGIENMRSLVDMMSKGKEESLKIINKRVDESINEIRASLETADKKAAK